MRKSLLGIFIGVAIAQVAHADPWVIEASYQDRAALQRASRHFEHVIVDKKRSLLRIDTNEKGIAALEAEGLSVSIDEAATARLNAFYSKAREASRRGLGIDGIPGYECFRTVEETYQSMDDLATNHPDIAAVDEIGPTWQKVQDPNEGYEMRAMHITNFATAASDPDRPKMAVYFSIHAREYTPAEIGTRFAEWLVHNYGTDSEATWLVDHNDFHLVVLANPDARKEAEQQIYHRKNMDDTYGDLSQCGDDAFSQFGVDLNRNFPFHWNITLGQGSDDDSCSQTFHGPYADGFPHNQHVQGDIEPETANLFSYVAGSCDADGNCTGGLFADRRVGPMNPTSPGDDPGDAAPDDTSGVFIDMHSNAALVLWPWGDTSTDSPNVGELTTFGRRIAFFNGYTPEQSNELYLTDGTTDDSMYGLLGVASYTIETNGFDFFEDCDSFESNTSPTNIEALRYVARNLHAPYRLPAGPDAVSVVANPDLVVAGDAVTVIANIDSSRYNESNGSQTVYDIASALGYVDALPWDGVAGTALAAGDGAFDSSVETGSVALPTTGLAAGRHFVYVQATDTNASAGTPNAAFFDVADASDIGTIEGTVVAASDQSPLAATITLSSETGSETHRAQTDSATGDYVLHAFPGQFDVRVSALHYMPQTIDGVSIEAGSSETHDFALLPDCVIFADDIENGAAAWTAQTPWVIDSNVPGNATHVWNTPDYGDGINRSLTTATAYDLTGYSDVTLDFDDRCDTESGYDWGYAEYSADNGSNWSTLYSCTGQTSWQSHHLELPASANDAAALKLRFRITSDFGQNAPGWAVDNVRLAAGGDRCLGQQVVDRLFASGFDPD